MSHHRTLIHRLSESDTAIQAWEGLTPDLLNKARDRIRKLAWLLLLLVGVGSLVDSAYYFRIIGRIDPLWLAATAAGLVMSAGMVLAARSERVSNFTVLRLGLGYEVAVCFLLALLMPIIVYSENGSLPFITWVEPLIILFPLIVPTPPRVALLVSIAAALTRPLGLLLLSLGDITVPVLNYLVSVMSPGFAVILAYAGSRIVHGMRIDLAQAQRMGSYELEIRLGSGGMGEVWQARHQLLARPAAIKLIRPETLGSTPERQEANLARFEREAQATAAMRSPHTIQLYDFGIAQNGTFYYVMELLKGLDLEEIVERFGPLRPARVVYLMLQASDSLGEAHDHGLIHRDVKPANMYLCRYGRHVDWIKVLDFGLVKSREEGDENANLTQEETVSGTPAFMAPEQIRGSKIDGRSDIYALGCVMYWLLTGSCPFEGKNAMDTLMMHLETEPVPPSARAEQPIPSALDRVVLACLEKEPASRPQTTDLLVEDLIECDVENSWTEARAREWWGRHLPDVKSTDG